MTPRRGTPGDSDNDESESDEDEDDSEDLLCGCDLYTVEEEVAEEERPQGDEGAATQEPSKRKMNKSKKKPKAKAKAKAKAASVAGKDQAVLGEGAQENKGADAHAAPETRDEPAKQPGETEETKTQERGQEEEQRPHQPPQPRGASVEKEEKEEEEEEPAHQPAQPPGASLRGHGPEDEEKPQPPPVATTTPPPVQDEETETAQRAQEDVQEELQLAEQHPQRELEEVQEEERRMNQNKMKKMKQEQAKKERAAAAQRQQEKEDAEKRELQLKRKMMAAKKRRAAARREQQQEIEEEKKRELQLEEEKEEELAREEERQKYEARRRRFEESLKRADEEKHAEAEQLKQREEEERRQEAAKAEQREQLHQKLFHPSWMKRRVDGREAAQQKEKEAQQQEAELPAEKVAKMGVERFRVVEGEGNAKSWQEWGLLAKGAQQLNPWQPTPDLESFMQSHGLVFLLPNARSIVGSGADWKKLNGLRQILAGVDRRVDLSKKPPKVEVQDAQELRQMMNNWLDKMMRLATDCEIGDALLRNFEAEGVGNGHAWSRVVTDHLLSLEDGGKRLPGNREETRPRWGDGKAGARLGLAPEKLEQLRLQAAGLVPRAEVPATIKPRDVGAAWDARKERRLLPYNEGDNPAVKLKKFQMFLYFASSEEVLAAAKKLGVYTDNMELERSKIPEFLSGLTTIQGAFINKVKRSIAINRAYLKIPDHGERGDFCAYDFEQ
ncbi:unnamed protein product [Amoebophrya sp. A25]|nr:unnamed protein product [Amoebophrya sp. A25]|eukprot:GSA25T00007152001.1